MTAAVQEKATSHKGVRAVARPVTAATPSDAKVERTLESVREAFGRVGHLLDDAASTDEDHKFCFDSDRLLRIAAFDARREGTSVDSLELADSLVFDALSLIKAARLVPGDVESPRRTELLEHAARELRWILSSDSSWSSSSELIDPMGARPELSHSFQAETEASGTPSAALDRQCLLDDTLVRAGAVLTMLVDLFGDTAGRAEPASARTVRGALQYLNDILAHAEDDLQGAPANELPRAVLTNLNSARSLSDLLLVILELNGPTWIYSDAIYSNYFDAINHCVRTMSDAMRGRNNV